MSLCTDVFSSNDDLQVAALYFQSLANTAQIEMWNTNNHDCLLLQREQMLSECIKS